MKKTRLLKKILLAGLIMFAAAQGICCKGKTVAERAVAAKGGAAAEIPEKDVFTCTSAGRWYPGSPGQLRTMVDGFLAKAEKNCFVSRSLRASVRVEPEFLHTPAEVAP